MVTNSFAEIQITEGALDAKLELKKPLLEKFLG
jgi:hypothetical protein